jgi:hypothetical protein
MAMIIFTVLNGLGVVFMLYVLVQFVKEGRRSKNPAARQHEIDLSYMDRPEIMVVTHPISHSAQGGLSVIPLQARERSLQGKQVLRDSADGTIEIKIPMKRYSSR